MARNSRAPTDARKHVHRLGGTLYLCGSFSSGTGSSHLASHEERSSAHVEPTLPLAFDSGLWPNFGNHGVVVFLRPAVDISS